MARPAYSKLLFEGAALPSGVTFSDLVPTGYVWVVREVVATLAETPALYTAGFTLADSETVPIVQALSPEAFAGRLYQWNLRSVLEAGDQLVFTAGEAGWSVRCSGYVLTA